MKESINYWTVACHKPQQGNKMRRLSDCRFISVSGEVRDYSAHAMIDNAQVALNFAEAIRAEGLPASLAGQQLVVEPVHILICPQEKRRLLKRIEEQSKAVDGFLTRRALAML
ncbi:hypothetical protein [Uliginosibacterium aquaticum]|uniref:Uncharacterized protein n=1 Tax=Uliginosibacterium aquaticum TaxID=2731212 RepID=A0ABX2IGR4_9RHOO|nr:hypothetical protein [Uliginosibacterium aquaticum]NSL55919.1 hypothetical protein [Uliginosibacterium aquaticum]